MRKSLLNLFLIPCILLSGCGRNTLKAATNEAAVTADTINKTYESMDRDLTVFRESILKLAYIVSSNGPMDRNVRFDAGNQILKALECDQKQADTWKAWAKKLTSDVDDPMHPQVSDELYNSIVKDLTNSYQNIKTKGSALKKKSNELNYKLAVLSGHAGNSGCNHTFMLFSTVSGLLALFGAYALRQKIVAFLAFLFKK